MAADQSLLTLKTMTRIINELTIAAGGERHADIVVLDQVTLGITVRIAYGAVAVAGIRVFLLASANNVNFDDEDVLHAWTFFDLPFAGAVVVRQKTVSVDSVPPYLRVLVRNLDAANAQGTISVYTTRRTQ